VESGLLDKGYIQRVQGRGGLQDRFGKHWGMIYSYTDFFFCPIVLKVPECIDVKKHTKVYIFKFPKDIVSMSVKRQISTHLTGLS